MNRNGVREESQEEPLSVFGRYIQLLYALLQTHQAEVARGVRISPSTISKAMRSTKRIEEETVLQIWQGFILVAQRKGMERILDASLQECFFNAAHCTTGEQVSRAEQRLEATARLLEVLQERRSSSG